ncbi:MAG: hypothetical protein QOI76_91 [Frankiales bacterium]|nr:hypothetical protein [Frankiales bacterium]
MRRPVTLSAALLVLGTAAVVARNEVVLRADQWWGYRDELQQIAAGRPWRTAHGLPALAAPATPAPLHVHDLLLQALPTGLTLLVAGALSLVLIASGRKVLWLPVALAGLSLHTNVVYLRGGPVDDQALPALTASLGIVLLAAVPILLSLRGVRLHQRMPNGQLIPTVVVVGALFADAVRSLGPWYSGDSNPPEAAPAFALFVFAALIVTGPLRRRWLAPVLVAPLLALPPLGVAASGVLRGNGWDAQDLTGVLWGAAVMLALGAVTPLLGRWAITGWRSLAARPSVPEASQAAPA